MGIAKRLERAWWRTDGKDWLSILLLDLSWIFGGLIKLRRKLYTTGVLDQTHLPVPVIVVGNCVVGGAGKTPITIALATFLQSQGYTPGIVSRGYGRLSTDVLEVLPDTPVHDSGDEPALIAQRTRCPVFVGTDRVTAAQALLAAHPSVNVILSDDGLQHLALQRDIEIIVFDERGLGNGRLLPAGPLREHWPRRAQPGVSQFVLYRGGLEPTSLPAFEIQRSLATHALRADGSHISLQELAAHEWTALAGIAQPEVFFNQLRAAGLRLREAIALPDHYDFNSNPIKFYDGQALICTEKDAVKLWRASWAQGWQIYAVPLHLKLPPAFTSKLLEQLSSPHGHQAA